MLRTPDAKGPWSRLQRLDFQARVVAHSVRRLGKWWADQRSFPAVSMAPTRTFPVTLAQVFVASRASSFGPRLEAGRWHNLRLAADAIDGVEVSADRPFSFWRAVGRLSAQRGYMEGAHFEGGCITPAVGGGICALSDALYEVALRADCEILERHAHTLFVARPGQPLPKRVDATVKWPYVDLRFAPRSGSLLLTCSVARDGITVAVRSRRSLARPVELAVEQTAPTREALLHTRLVRIREGEREVVGRDRKRVVEQPKRTCDTCEETSCRHHRNRRVG